MNPIVSIRSRLVRRWVLFLNASLNRKALLLFLYTELAVSALALGLLSAYNVRWAVALFNVSFALLSALFLHFHVVFPRSCVFFDRPSVIGGFYAVGSLLALPAVPFLTRPAPPLWYPIWRSWTRYYFVLAAIMSIGLLLYTYLTYHDRRVRRQVRVIALGTAGAIVPLVSLVVLPQALIGVSLIQPEMVFLSLALIPVAYAIAVYKHDLFRVDRFLNRSVVYFCLGVLWVFAFLGIDFGLSSVSVLAPVRRVLAALLSFLMALALVALRPRLQQRVDQAFYGSWYDYRSVITHVSRALHEAHDERTLVEYLIDRVGSAIDLRGIALFLNKKTGQMMLYGQRGFAELAQALYLSADGSLASCLRREGKPMRTPDLRGEVSGHALSRDEQAWLAHDAVRLWIPLLSREKLKGLLLFGDKATGEPFDAEDLRILETLGRQAAVEITLFRVFQEALTNVVKHAEAENVWVTERLTDAYVELVIRDDGLGFALPARLAEIAGHGHFGLLGIEERMAAVGGTMRITSEPGQGTEVWVQAPLDRGG